MNLAAKYRPQDFDDMEGQENTRLILQNQIDSNDIRNAYLFTGGAGTGKTTSARIFALKINGSYDGIIEIDGASNNSVDNIRDLRENCKFKPISTKYKVYIIDEVHMLSTGAFNALLKTLEEPPAHAIFILATTDPQKIPATIMSRVQRFDFRRIPTDRIIARLQYIIEVENEEKDLQELEQYSINDDAFEYMAKLADGGMRDAISILDTCLSYSNTLTLEDVYAILGNVNIAIFMNLIDVLLDKNTTEVINIIEKSHLEGKDLKQFINGFTNVLIDILKYQTLQDFTYIQTPSAFNKSIEDFANDDRKILLSLLNTTIKISQEIKYISSPKTTIEGALMLWLEL